MAKILFSEGHYLLIFGGIMEKQILMIINILNTYNIKTIPCTPPEIRVGKYIQTLFRY
jgi:hypothetical protein